MHTSTSAKGPWWAWSTALLPSSYPVKIRLRTYNKSLMSTNWWRSLVCPTSSARVGHTRLPMASSTPRPGKGPVFGRTTAPMWHPHWRCEACHHWPEVKARFVWIVSILYTWWEGSSSQHSSSSWLAPRSSPPRIWKQSEGACTTSTAAQRRSGGSYEN